LSFGWQAILQSVGCPAKNASSAESAGTQCVSTQCNTLVANGVDVTNARHPEGAAQYIGREQDVDRRGGRLTTETRKHGAEKPGKEVRANQRLAISNCIRVGIDHLGRQSPICANEL
jgi:hypothetical protein